MLVFCKWLLDDGPSWPETCGRTSMALHYDKCAFSWFQLQQLYCNAWQTQHKKSHYFSIVLNLCLHKLEVAICLLYMNSNLSVHCLYLVVHLTQNSPYYKLCSILLPLCYKTWTYLPTVYWHSQQSHHGVPTEWSGSVHCTHTTSSPGTGS
jgi:hypothetical protein